jgi:trk system potassium uptake protein TrkA
MKILVIGCGRLGAELAYRLFLQDHQVTVVDSTATAFVNLPADFRGRLLEGEVLSRDVLDRARIEEADAVAAVTSSDAVNAVVGHVARELFSVPNVAVRNFDPRRRDLLETFDLPTVASTSWGAARFEELLTCAAARGVLSVGNGEVEVFELAVGDAGSGLPLREALVGANVFPVAVTRQGNAQLPEPDTVLESGDHLLVSGALAGVRVVAERVGALGQEG